MDVLASGRILRGQVGADHMRSHHAAQIDVQFKTCKLFISGIFHLTLYQHGSRM